VLLIVAVALWTRRLDPEHFVPRLRKHPTPHP
jgi:hypothetical protein